MSWNDERFKNMMLFGAYATDDELTEMAPCICWGFIILIIIGIIYYILN